MLLACPRPLAMAAIPLKDCKTNVTQIKVPLSEASSSSPFEVDLACVEVLAQDEDEVRVRGVVGPVDVSFVLIVFFLFLLVRKRPKDLELGGAQFHWGFLAT